jgi:hypothetical protein
LRRLGARKLELATLQGRWRADGGVVRSALARLRQWDGIGAANTNVAALQFGLSLEDGPDKRFAAELTLSAARQAAPYCHARKVIIEEETAPTINVIDKRDMGRMLTVNGSNGHGGSNGSNGSHGGNGSTNGHGSNGSTNGHGGGNGSGHGTVN